MWNIALHTNGAGCIYTEYAYTKHMYIYIYRQFFVFTTSVGLAALAPITKLAKHLQNCGAVVANMQKFAVFRVFRYYIFSPLSFEVQVNNDQGGVKPKQTCKLHDWCYHIWFRLRNVPVLGCIRVFGGGGFS